VVKRKKKKKAAPSKLRASVCTRCAYALWDKRTTRGICQAPDRPIIGLPKCVQQYKSDITKAYNGPKYAADICPVLVSNTEARKQALTDQQRHIEVRDAKMRPEQLKRVTAFAQGAIIRARETVRFASMCCDHSFRPHEELREIERWLVSIIREGSTVISEAERQAEIIEATGKTKPKEG